MALLHKSFIQFRHFHKILRTSKSIKEILDFAPGTIIELNRLAGEPIDVLVNGKYVAKGEVVVIEEAFGIRVTEIIKDK